mgnify:CR=1 FL=1
MKYNKKLLSYYTIDLKDLLSYVKKQLTSFKKLAVDLYFNISLEKHL